MKQGFSLVELSIVLVILGLLTGGILAGQSLIRASELRAVSTEYQRYITAAQTFRDKYFAIPGDMSNATKFWGDDNAACPDAAVANGTPGTCSGNGDGNVNDAGAASATGELYQFWKQLALAGLIEGTYSGLAGTSWGSSDNAGVNTPISKLGNASWATHYIAPPFAGSANYYAVDFLNALIFGGRCGGGACWNDQPVLKPEEAWNIDTKMDDGRPAYGKIIAVFWNNLCAAADDGSHANTDLVASYKLTDNTARCALGFPRAF